MAKNGKYLVNTNSKKIHLAIQRTADVKLKE